MTALIAQPMKPYHADKPFSKGTFFFVTLWLRQALPEHFLQNLGLQFYIQQCRWRQHPGGEKQLHQIRKQLFARFDRALDDLVYGPGIFQDDSMATIVAQEIKRKDGVDYDLSAFCILPNHVHLLLEINAPPIQNPSLQEYDVLIHPTLRHIVQNIHHATSAPLTSALAQAESLMLPAAFRKHSEQGLILLEGSPWHERSFDFQIQDNIELEKATSFIHRNAASTMHSAA